MKKNKQILIIFGLVVSISVLMAGLAYHTAPSFTLGGSYCFPYQGCTGATSTPSSGQVLVGNASGTYSVANLTAGSNVTITTSSGGITIGSTGGSGSVSTSSAITANHFPFWFNTTGGLSGTSSLTINGTTV